MKTNIIKRNNVNFVGQGNQTLIFAHGFGADQTVWRHQVAAFESDYRIVLFDHVGAGKSDFTAFHPHRYSSLYGYKAVKSGGSTPLRQQYPLLLAGVKLKSRKIN